MAETNLYDQRAKLRDYKKGLYAFYLLKTGIALGLFQKLNTSDVGLRPGDLANELNLHEPYVNIWCQTAYHMEILDFNKDGRYTLAPHMGTLLADTESPYYLGHEIQMRTSYTVDQLRRHPEYFKSGKTHYCQSDGPEFSTAQKAMTNQGTHFAYIFLIIPSIPELKERLDAGMRVLDVGCGSGFLIIQLAKAFPNSRFLGVEIDKFAVADAQRSIKENAVEDRVSVALADANSLGYKKEFDLVNMAFVLHEIQSHAKHNTISNCYQALSDSGKILIFDFAYPGSLSDFRKPEFTEGILDQFHESTWCSEHISTSARHQLLQDFGFRDPATIPVVDGSLEATHATK
jgi:SAM-dependent methyltransferase